MLNPIQKGLVFLCLSFFFTTINAQEAFTIDQYHVDAEIQENGDVIFNEIIDVTFTEKRRGLYRTIPTSYEIENRSVNARIEVLSVDRWNYKTTRKSKSTEIRFGDPDIYLKGKQQYAFRYLVKKSIFAFEDHHSFYWNILGDQWDTTTDKFTYKITLPKSINLGPEDFRVYSGKYGSVAQHASIAFDSQIVSGESTQQIQANEAITVAIKFPKDYLSLDYDLSKEELSLPKGSVGFPLGILSLLLFYWNKFGRNRKVYELDQPVTHPPLGLRPEEIGLMMDGVVNNRDILSLIPYWGNQGYLKMVKTGPEDDDIVFEKLANLDSGEPEHAKIFFKKLFDKSNSTAVRDLQKKSNYSMFKASKALSQSKFSSKFYDQEAIRKFNGWQMIAASALSIVIGIIAMTLFNSPIIFAACLVLGVVCMIIRLIEPKRTDLGQEVKASIKSFKNYLESGSDFGRHEIDYFEKMFPYAIAMGVDKAFMQSFKAADHDSPSWYYGYGDSTHNNSFTQFSETYSTKTIHSAFTPKSSSGESGGGGGFSGGGGGGGGGGSW